MRKWTPYEVYLHEQRSFFFYEEDEENEYPHWLRFEDSAYYWMFRLTRRIRRSLQEGGTLSTALQEQMKNAADNRRLRYRSISPELREAVGTFAVALSCIYTELRREPGYWLNPYTLSKQGCRYLQESLEEIEQFFALKPDRRVQRERDVAYPNLSRYDAFEIGRSALEKAFGIRVERDDDRGQLPRYHMYTRCRNSRLTGSLIKIDRDMGAFDEIGSVEVDLASGGCRIFVGENGSNADVCHHGH